MKFQLLRIRTGITASILYRMERAGFLTEYVGENHPSVSSGSLGPYIDRPARMMESDAGGFMGFPL